VTPCAYCSGTRYLNDHPGLGPCACVTPEAVVALVRDLAEATALARDAALFAARLVDSRAKTADRIRRYRAHMADIWPEEGDEADELRRAADALQAYLTRWGHPARPFHLPDPLLWELWQSLEDYAA
jgi:ABC-type nitrate/sulfonate/bicarbonate transport system substrate-binding protein